MSLPAAAADVKNSIIELRYYKLRNTTDGMVRSGQRILSAAPMFRHCSAPDTDRLARSIA